MGTRIVAINGRPVHSWNDVSEGIANSPESELRLELDNGRTVTLPIHQDALEERLKAAQALQPFRPAVIGQVLPADRRRGRAAAGDTILAIGDRPIAQWYDVLEVLQANTGTSLTMTVAWRQRSAHPRLAARGGDGRGPRRQAAEGGAGGDSAALDTRSEPLSLGQAFTEGLERNRQLSTQIVRTVRGLFTGRISRREVGGPIMIGQLAGESARMGLDPFLAFMALISINLAVLNLLPVPVLDGGQFLFLLAEAVIRRPLPLKLRERLTAVGMVLIVLLMGLAFSNDIRRLFGG